MPDALSTGGPLQAACSVKCASFKRRCPGLCVHVCLCLCPCPQRVTAGPCTASHLAPAVLADSHHPSLLIVHELQQADNRPGQSQAEGLSGNSSTAGAAMKLQLSGQRSVCRLNRDMHVGPRCVDHHHQHLHHHACVCWETWGRQRKREWSVVPSTAGTVQAHLASEQAASHTSWMAAHTSMRAAHLQVVWLWPCDDCGLDDVRVYAPEAAVAPDALPLLVRHTPPAATNRGR